MEQPTVLKKWKAKLSGGVGVIVPVGAVFNRIFLSSPSDLRQNMADVRRQRRRMLSLASASSP